MVMPSHINLLQPHEQGYASQEKILRIALRFLLRSSSPQPERCAEPDYAGLTLKDQASPFYESLSNRRWPYTADQLRVLYKALSENYAEVLRANGIGLPLDFEVPVAVAPRTRARVDIRETAIFVTFPYPQGKEKMDALALVIRQQEGNTCRYTGNAEREWTMPLTEKNFLLACTYFQGAEITPAARAYQQTLVEKKRRAEPSSADDARLRTYRTLMQAVNNLEGEIVSGVTLYEHQKEAIRAMLWRHWFILGDEVGLGKTFPAIVAAKALQNTYGYRIHIVSTKSSLDMWLEAAALFEVQITVIGWSELMSMKFEEGETFTEDFVLISDEVHYAKNSGSRRSKKWLDLARMRHCKAHYALSGTVVANGRPIELYNILLGVRHPLVYSTNSRQVEKLRMQYWTVFCNRHRKHIGSGTYVWDMNGATNTDEFHDLLFYEVGRENHKDACIMVRLKKDVTDLPEKQRVLLPVMLSVDATHVFKDAMARMWTDYKARVEEKIRLFRETHPFATESDVATERRKINKAQAMVSGVFFRHAGAIAKLETTLEYARMIAPNGKVVIFTSFKDVAQLVGDKLTEEFGEGSVGYILGNMSREARSAAMTAFQNPSNTMRFIISTAAGGESITLTTAQHMLIIDRLWSPKDVMQWEGRIHRMTTTGVVTIFWLQLPKDITEADIRIDEVLEGKQSTIDLMQFGKPKSGIRFIPLTDLHNQSEAVLYLAYMQTCKKRGVALEG